ncbi:MAG TPA: VLRF1 family aeRF1-type release factor [Lentibacillus sp.]|uniref:VLRF1 family aeRF1-type release factor n=1 Tax=Lentibacillus sp. TaxID=1925746 RepID=UPI002B4B3CC1|nr:VLRF1 family aeRF1-type release factor [Lentibacillus sp.]HLR61312.1 VLRF1 family aeRF1-type release factor [Lentibacillus sp.]
MDLRQQIKQLENIKKEQDNKVLTMYLNTDPSDPEQQAGEWKIHLKNGLRNFESYLEEDNNKEELKNFQLVKQKVEKFVHGNEQHFRKGIILFASADEEVWFADRFQMPVKTEFFWEEEPVLGQLKELLETYPKSGIILVQKNEVKLIEAHLNEILDTEYYELDINTEKWRQFSGPHQAQASMGSGGKSLQQDKFNARYEANKQRWYKNIAPKLEKKAKDQGWENIYVIGEPDDASELENELNKPVTELVQKNLLDHEESKVLEEIFG